MSSYWKEKKNFFFVFLLNSRNDFWWHMTSTGRAFFLSHSFFLRLVSETPIVHFMFFSWGLFDLWIFRGGVLDFGRKSDITDMILDQSEDVEFDGCDISVRPLRENSRARDCWADDWIDWSRCDGSEALLDVTCDWCEVGPLRYVSIRALHNSEEVSIDGLQYTGWMWGSTGIMDAMRR